VATDRRVTAIVIVTIVTLISATRARFPLVTVVTPPAWGIGAVIAGTTPAARVAVSVTR
jgi:hypothetical protein